MYTVLFVLLLGCKPPPDAPAELDALVGYLYEHTDDDDESFLVVGSDHLDSWLDVRLHETLEGYSVDNLSATAIAELELGNPDITGLAGAAVGHDGPNPVEELGVAIAAAPALDIYTGNYTDYHREYEGDVDCFVAGDCAWLESVVESTASYALGIDVTSRSRVQYRWVETEAGPVFVQRSWMMEPADISVEWLTVDQQFFLWMIIPDEGGSRSIQATWVIATITGAQVPEGVALNMVVDQMRTFAEELDAYVGG